MLGPLPRSWMTAQWQLQKSRILPRMRALGIAGQLPAFQGNLPWALARTRIATCVVILIELGPSFRTRIATIYVLLALAGLQAPGHQHVPRRRRRPVPLLRRLLISYQDRRMLR